MQAVGRSPEHRRLPHGCPHRHRVKTAAPGASMRAGGANPWCTRYNLVYVTVFLVNVFLLAALFWALDNEEQPQKGSNEKALDSSASRSHGGAGSRDHPFSPRWKNRHATGPHDPDKAKPKHLNNKPEVTSQPVEKPGTQQSYNTVSQGHRKVSSPWMTLKRTVPTQSSTTGSTTLPSTSETTENEHYLAGLNSTLETNTSTPTASTTIVTIIPVTDSISLTAEVVTTSTVTFTTATTTEEVFSFEVERSSSYNVVCYFNHTSYRRAKPMSFRTGHIPVPFCSHIIYASLGVNEDAELVPKDPVFDIEQGGFAKFASIKKRHPQVSVMVAIGEDIGDSMAFLQLSKYKQDAVALARNAASWLLGNRYDGLVVQWKMPASRHDVSATMGPRYKARLRMIVAALRDSLGSKTEIFVTVPNDEERRQKYFDLPALSRHVDRFLAISNWLLPSEGRTGSGARSKVTSLPDPINDVLHTRHTLVRDGKGEIYRKFCFVLDVGARTYTLAWSGHHDVHAAILGPGKPGPYTGLPGTMAYYEFCNETWATMVKRTFASYVARDDQWVGYLDTSNLERLLRMMLYKHRASCVGIWDVSLDDFRGVCGDPFPFTKMISAWKEKRVKFRSRTSGNI